MKETTKKRLLLSYVIGVILTLFGVYGGDRFNIYLLLAGAPLVIIPWFWCMFDATKLKDNGGLWFLMLLVMGGIGIPVYLLGNRTR